MCDKCRKAEKNKGPQASLPQWAYDAPYYFRPPAGVSPRPTERVEPQGKGEYYVNSRTVLIERPAGGVPLDRAPRIAVCAAPEGHSCQLAGYFGLGQTHFPFVVKKDGNYEIRFEGPGTTDLPCPGPQAHRLYHVDTCPPAVTVCVDSQETDVPAGQQIEILWTVRDPNLDCKSVELAVCMNCTPAGQQCPGWQPLEPVGDARSVRFTVPADMVGKSLQFRVAADDLAGNHGAGYSPVLNVLPAAQQEQTASRE
jgi:hypothetical protein